MVKTLLMRGMIAGALAGLLAFGFARVFGEPQIDKAIAFEEQMEKAEKANIEQRHSESSSQHEHGHVVVAAPPAADEAELVSRGVQANLGLFVAITVNGAAIGGLFGLIFAFAYGRVGRLGPRVTAALLSVGGFISITVVPFLKYPANPPAASSPDTVGIRTALFLTMIAISIAALTLAIGLLRSLVARFGYWNAGIIAGGIFIAMIAIAQLVLPDVNEVPDSFSADVLWRFRVASLGMQTVMWTTLGLVFGALASRTLDSRGSVTS